MLFSRPSGAPCGKAAAAGAKAPRGFPLRQSRCGGLAGLAAGIGFVSLPAWAPFQRPRRGCLFTNVNRRRYKTTQQIYICKCWVGRGAPVKYYGGPPPSLPGCIPPGQHPRPACPLAPVGPFGVPSPRWGFGRRRPAGRASPSRQGGRAGLPSTPNDNPLRGSSLDVEGKPPAPKKMHLTPT